MGPKDKYLQEEESIVALESSCSLLVDNAIPGLSTLSTTGSSEPVFPKAEESRPLLLFTVVVYVQKLCEGKSAPARGSPSPARAPTRLN